MEKSEKKNFLQEVFLDKGRNYCLKSKKGHNVIAPKQGTLYLFEWQEYRIIGKRAFTVKIGNENFKAEKINENTYIATFQFKNYIGKTTIEILEGIKPLSLEFKNFEVLSKKVDEIYKGIEDIVEKHKKLYKALVEYISEKSISLPFSISTPTAFGVKESEGPMNELFVYHFLMDNRERIISAYEEIMKNPHRKLIERQEWMNFWEVTEIDEDTIVTIITHPEYMTKAERSPGAVARYLNEHVPTKVAQKIKYESFDTHENRFAKYFLNELIIWSERAKNAIEKSQYLQKKMKMPVIENLSKVLGELEYYATSDVFDDVGEMVIFPYNSQVLLKREGYRDLLQLWREFRSYSPFFGEIQEAIDNKDIAKLYEYWCFFRLVEELGNILGWKDLKIVIEPTGELSERGNVYALFDNGWRLYYNKRLTSRKWSYSVTLRPDYSLFKGNKLVGVFDAKFKLDIVDEKEEVENFDVEDEEVERSGSYTTWAKLEDIYKMHTYRDALGCRFAVVVYPGSISRMFFNKIDKEKIKEKKTIFEGLSTEKKLLRLLVWALAEGVGYLKFVPEVENHE